MMHQNAILYMTVGMLSKSMGQILCVSAAMHTLLSMETEVCDDISQMAIDAAINFVEVCCQHTAFITGRGNIDDQLQNIDSGKTFPQVYYHFYVGLLMLALTITPVHTCTCTM